MNDSKHENASTQAPLNARMLATLVLERVLSEGAYASRALDAELSRAALDPRDAGLATDIVYGSLRAMFALEPRIAAHLRKPIAQLDTMVRAALLGASYQLLHGQKLPPYAIVNETVNLVRAKRGPHVAGFVNAVLRKIASERLEQPALAVLALPAWLEQAMRSDLGAARYDAYVHARAMPPAMALRVQAEHVERSALRAAITASHPNATVSDGALSPLCVLVQRAGDPRKLPGYAEGHFAVQEEGAQWAAQCLGAMPGERVADVCCGHGGKTALLATQVGPQGQVTAIDRDPQKVAMIGPELLRLGVDGSRVETHAIDLGVGLGGLGPVFDRVLVDAPCTGLGTLHRRPELMLRLSKNDIARMADLQLKILARALGLVRPGGVLVYVVCSPLAAEGPGVVDRVQKAHPTLERFVPAAASQHADADGVLRIGPWSAADTASSPDAYQVIALRVP